MNTFYVDRVSGDDARDGLTAATALESLVAAATKAAKSSTSEARNSG